MKNASTLWSFSSLFALSLGMMLTLSNCSSDDNDNDDSSITGTNNGTTVISDSLKNGKTISNAMLVGGVFTSEGYKITSEEGYIGYETTISKNIVVEFDAKGYVNNEPAHMEVDPPDDVANLLSMHDAPIGMDWREPTWRIVPYCSFRLRKKLALDGQIGINGIQVKGGCRDSGFEIGSYFLWNARNEGEWLDNWGIGNAVSWDSTKTYHWKVTVVDGHTEIYRDGVKLGWGEGFLPQERYVVYIGGADWAHEGVFSPANVTYSNIKISRVE